MWPSLVREGYQVGRDQTAWLMKLTGVNGKTKGRGATTTHPAREDHRTDLVHRIFHPDAPCKLRGADISHLRATSGFVYAALAIYAFPGGLQA